MDNFIEGPYSGIVILKIRIFLEYTRYIFLIPRIFSQQNNSKNVGKYVARIHYFSLLFIISMWV